MEKNNPKGPQTTKNPIRFQITCFYQTDIEFILHLTITCVLGSRSSPCLPDLVLHYTNIKQDQENQDYVYFVLQH